MTPQPLSHLSTQEILRLKEQQIEQERMQNILLVIDNLFRREAETAKLVLEYLYDVGHVNLINQKLKCRHLQGLCKGAARFSKPLFGRIALIWFQNNCPKLITDWLYTLVVFQPSAPPPTPEPSPALEGSQGLRSAQPALPSAPSELEIKRLRAQVRWSTGVAIASLVALVGTIVYTNYQLQGNPIRLFQPTEIARRVFAPR